MIAMPYAPADWNAVLPLVILAGSALLVLCVDFFLTENAKRWLPIALGVLGTLVTVVATALQYNLRTAAFGGAFLSGGFTVVFEEIVLAGALGSVILYGVLGKRAHLAGVIALMLWSACGAMLMSGAGNLMTIFLGIELLSLALYSLCGLGETAPAREAALKYLILSSTASGFMLFGMALLFGASGSIALAPLASTAMANNPLFWMGSALFSVGLIFKLGLVPFHAWSPDVYEGAPLPVTAFMSVATKAGAIAILARFIYAALPTGVGDRLLLPLWIIAALSILVGNLGMLAQMDLKRLLAYSGIAQIGYILVALAGSSALGLRYAMYYLGAYALMNLGAFAVAALLSGEREEGVRLANYRGLARRRPLLAALMTVFLLALAGLPPTAGFLGKILILATSVNSGFAWLGGVLILGTAISLFAYAKIIRAMYVRDDHAGVQLPAPVLPLVWASAMLCALALIVFTFYPFFPSNVLPTVQ